ncbi:hypothetical protein [Flavobacterium pedocola]
MESGGHFIFELLKIGILGFIYANIIWFIFKGIAKRKNVFWLQKALESKRRLWIWSSIVLFVYMLTPFGYHGLGDSARIPLGFRNEISNINWTEYGSLYDIETSEGNPLETTAFLLKNNMVCGNLSSGFYDYKNSFFVYDLSTEQLKEFVTETDYNQYAEKQNLPLSAEFKSFEENYRAYWGGWRFFLLP